MNTSTPPLEIINATDTLVSDGQLEAAIKRLQAGLQMKPEYFAGWLKLSRVLFDAERFAEAVSVTRTAEQIDPLSGQFGQIQQAMQARNGAAARQIAEAMLRAQPGHPRAIFTLAHLCLSAGDSDAAIDLLQLGLETSPADLALRAMVIGALEQAAQYREAIEQAEQITRLDPGFDAQWRRVSLLLRYGQNEQALAACQALDTLTGLDASRRGAIELVRGQLLRILGHREDSIAAFRRSLELNPANANAWWGLADLKNFAFTDADRTALEHLLQRPGLHPQEKCMAAFALAKAEECKDDPAAAMARYHAANQIYPARSFNAEGFKTGIERITTQVTADAVKQQAAPRPDTPRPIFVLGLPRSGSTLVEQILASHSKVEGTMEQPTLPAIKQRAHLICARELGGSYLTHLGQLPQAALNGLGQRYLDGSALFRREGAPYFVDKLPHNFEHIGLIHKIMPEAVIVDVRRNPMDCGYSLYKQYFAQGVEFSYRLENIAQYCNGYLELLDHWDAVLPGRVFHLQYEQLVSDPEATVKALLDHIGLAFEPACLDFHKTDRAVRTASSEQVRQPLNAKGVGAWKAVADELEPLRAALGEATLKRFQPWL